MTILIDSAEFSSNEVYEIQQTDAVEGAGVGASFGGIGVSNQPHQQLANRSAFLKGRQDTNIANIGILQAFQALFRGSMGSNGYVQIPFLDAERGQISAIIQWGTIALLGQTQGAVKNGAFSASFPIAFPTACYGQVATWQTNSIAGDEAMVSGIVMLECRTPYVKNAITVATDWDNGGYPGGGGTVHIATTATDGNGITGIQWFAWGF
jgi:hypothetical protein